MGHEPETVRAGSSWNETVRDQRNREADSKQKVGGRVWAEAHSCPVSELRELGEGVRVGQP